MPTFIMLGNFTQHGIENIKDLQKQMALSVKLGKEHGIELKAMYLTFGKYDWVAITEAPSMEVSMQRLLAMCSRGFVRTETLVAIPADKGIELINKLE